MTAATPTPATPAAATRRADAQRNRRNVLETADRLFAERGAAVSLGEIAAAAGVGAGTVYRHFPTKDALLATVLDRRLRHIAAVGERALREDDPVAAFFGYLRSLTDMALENRAICEALAERDDWTRPDKAGGACVIDPPMSRLLERAQEAGAVRRDLDSEDVRALLSGCTGIAHAAPERGRRLASVLWDGLRTERNPAIRDETPLRADHRNESFVTEGACPVCGNPLARSATGRPAKFCSAACRQKAFRDKRRTA